MSLSNDFDAVTRSASALHVGQRVRGPHLILNFQRGFSVKDIPKDPHGQVYDAAILLDTPKRPYRIALQVAQDNADSLSKLTSVYKVMLAVEKLAREAGAKRDPRWHNYSMPD
jgi:hypothetical protein